MPTWAHLTVLVGALVVLALVAELVVTAVLVLSRRWRIPPAIAGATFAAAATSMPELGTNVAALLQASESGGAAAANIGAGGIIGSAVFNLTVVVAAVGLTGLTRLSKRALIRENAVYMFSVVTTLAFVFLIGTAPRALERFEGWILVAAYGLYVAWLVRDTMVDQQNGGPATLDETTYEEERPQVSTGRAVAMLTASVAVIAVACHFLVESTLVMSQRAGAALGVDDAEFAAAISVTVVAIATSIPDALTSVAAARRGHGGLAVGNAIGSNTFDLLIGLGLPAGLLGGWTLAGPIALTGGWLVATTFLLPALLMRRWSVGPAIGWFLLVLYGAFTASVVVSVAV